MSLTPLATENLNASRGAVGAPVSPDEAFGSRQNMEAAVKQWALQALGAIAEKGEEVDASGVKDGVASREEIRAALKNGVFDGDPRKAAVERLLNDPGTLAQLAGRFNDAAKDPFALPLAALKEYRERLAVTHTDGDRDERRQPGAQSGMDANSGGERDGEQGFWKVLPSERRLSAENPSAVKRDFARDHLTRTQSAQSAQSAVIQPPRTSVNGLASSAMGAPAAAQPAGVFDLRPLVAAVSQPPAVAAVSRTGTLPPAGQAAASVATPGVLQPPAAAPAPAPTPNPTPTPVATTRIDPTQSNAQRFREVVVNNFGFLDSASAGTAQSAAMARDGRVSAADVAAAASSQMLDAGNAEMLGRLAADPQAFSQLDGRDGLTDGLITFSSTWRAATPGERDLLTPDLAPEIPDVRVADYSDRFFALEQSAASGGVDPRASLGGDLAGLNALDAMDGASDGAVNPAGVALFGVDTKQEIFSAPANDGSGRPVLQAALKAMGEEFAGQPKLELPPDVAADRPRAFRLALALWDNLGKLPQSATLPQAQASVLSVSREDLAALASNPGVSAADVVSLGQLTQDPAVWNWLSAQAGGAPGDRISYDTLRNVVTAFNKENFSGIMMAAGAVNNGVPMKTGRFSGASFSQDMSAEFASSQVFDPALALKAYGRLMGDANIQDVLSEKVRQFTPNAPTQARQLFNELTSQHYRDSLQYLETLPNGSSLSEQKLATDLAALGTLDRELAQEASAVLLQGKLVDELAKSTPSAVPPDQMLLATRDFLMSLSLDMRSARGFVRLPGLLAGHDAGWKQIGALIKDWPAQRIESLASALSEALIKADQGARAQGFVGIPSAEAVTNAAAKTATDASESARSAATPAERTRLQVIADRAAAGAREIKDFVAACEKNGLWASMAGGISLAGGVYKLVKGGENLKGNSWGRLSIANDFVLATCFGPGYINSTNWVLNRFNRGFSLPDYGLAPNQTFSNLVKAFWTGDTAAVGTSMTGTSVGMAVKGLTGGSLLAAGSIGAAMGIKQVVDGVKSGEEFDIAAGSLNIAMGTSWAASGVAYLMASAMTGPLIGIGCAFGVVSVFLSAFGPKPDQQFADSFEERVGSFADAGVLREGWRDSVRSWFRDNQGPAPDQNTPGHTGMGIDM